MNLFSWDIETIKNCFTAVFQNIKTNEYHEFVICEWRNDYLALRDFLKQKDIGLVGYNSVDFDYPVIHKIIEKDYRLWNGDRIASMLYDRAQKTIDGELKERPAHLVPQLDIFRVWHLNNKARFTSLKWLQICMGHPNVMDMPLRHDEPVTEDLIPTVLDYNKNDVSATTAFYKLTIPKIKLRKALTEKYGVDFRNFSDNKIGETIFLLELSKRTGTDIKTLRKMTTKRTKILGIECMPQDIHFSTEPFQKIHEAFKRLVITVGDKRTDDKAMFSTVFDGVKYDMGEGGIHGLREPGIYEDIEDADAASFYPHLAISNRYYPQHMGEMFCDVYKGIYDERKKYDKKSAENAAFKLALNGAFGQSKAEWSAFYDEKFFYSITITGQLLLALLCERMTVLRAAQIICCNTDGVTYRVLDRAKLDKVFDLWQREFKMTLEFTKYKKFACANVNNYIAITDKGEVKEKGAFETVKEIFKDQSMRIVPLAVRAYFEKGIPIETTINECQDMKLFVMGIRAKTGTLRYKWSRNGEFFHEPLPKNVRYFVSKEGGQIVKVTKSTKKVIVDPKQINLFAVIDTKEAEKITGVHIGYSVTLFNLWVDKPFEQYGVDKSFYINEANKIVQSVNQK